MTNVKVLKGVQMKEYDCRKNTNYVKTWLRCQCEYINLQSIKITKSGC